MPELLGATNPVPGYDKTTVNRNITVSPDNTQIQNVPDPSKVVRADGRTEQQDSNLQGDGGNLLRLQLSNLPPAAAGHSQPGGQPLPHLLGAGGHRRLLRPQDRKSVV